MCKDPRYSELYGVRLEIPAFELVRTVRTIQASRDDEIADYDWLKIRNDESECNKGLY